jgi:lipopolysaccharide/colanic/teichoic acid biosynthesis glycosyltransferase
MARGGHREGETVRRVAKHTADKLVAASGLVIVLPVLVGVALALRLRGAGPVLKRERRVGERGRVLVLRSFLLPRDPGVWQLVARTGVGALPQLWSVLRGELSLVGPRPRALGLEPPPVRPGMTGPAQVADLDRTLSVDEQLALDADYARTWSLRTDARILARTFARSLR